MFQWRWYSIRDGNLAALALYRRHYSAPQYRDNRRAVGTPNWNLFAGPGEKMVLLTPDSLALFVWRKFVDMRQEPGVNCAVFRNEGPHLSSSLIKEASALAWQRWPGERLYTYVNPHKIKSSNPGYCFQMAGWRNCGSTQNGLVILDVYDQRTYPGE